MRLARRGFAAATLALALFAAGCGSDSNDNGGGTAQDLSGNYLIASGGIVYTPAGTTTPITIEGTGTAELTATNYTINLSITDPVFAAAFPPTNTGTYTATGTPSSGTFSQIPANAQQPQAVGTYTYDSSTKVLVLSTDVASFGNLRITMTKQ